IRTPRSLSSGNVCLTSPPGVTPYTGFTRSARPATIAGERFLPAVEVRAGSKRIEPTPLIYCRTG
ncbi:MAG: hypothetical protein M3440_13010, partial [Chloroflexota bacterium]|nr:hypothetical protein [Chloroflexota bacterium]